MLVIWSALGVGASAADEAPGRNHPGAEDQHQLHKQNQADQQTDRQICERTLAQLGEIDVEHHDDEQEQHRHRADIDDDQDHRQELGAQQHEQPGRVEKGQDQEQIPNARDCAP